MSDRRKNRDNRRNIFKEQGFAAFSQESREYVLEKKRAKDLRESSWWKKKTSQGVCHYCSGRFKPSELTMDHKIPLSRGGRSEKENLVPACKECNNRKKYLLPIEWDEYMSRIKNS